MKGLPTPGNKRVTQVCPSSCREGIGEWRVPGKIGEYLWQEIFQCEIIEYCVSQIYISQGVSELWLRGWAPDRVAQFSGSSFFFLTGGTICALSDHLLLIFAASPPPPPCSIGEYLHEEMVHGWVRGAWRGSRSSRWLTVMMAMDGLHTIQARISLLRSPCIPCQAESTGSHHPQSKTPFILLFALL